MHLDIALLLASDWVDPATVLGGDMLSPLRAFVLVASIRLCLSQTSSEDRYAFGSVAVETAPGEGASVTGVHSLVYYTFSDDYPYACKCAAWHKNTLDACLDRLERHVAGSIVGYCKNDNNMPCYLTQDALDGGQHSARILKPYPRNFELVYVLAGPFSAWYLQLAGDEASFPEAMKFLRVCSRVLQVTGDRFFAKGVAYNPRNEHYDKSFGQSVKVEGWDHCVPGRPKGGEWSYTEDVIADEHEDVWSVDLEAIADLGANTVRLYNVNPQNNHSKFMEKALSLGLYVIVPLNGKDWGYLPAFASPDCYTQDEDGRRYGNVGVNAFSFAKQVVQEFSRYNNTLLLTVANELAT
eukprot:s952_g16.t3